MKKRWWQKKVAAILKAGGIRGSTWSYKNVEKTFKKQRKLEAGNSSCYEMLRWGGQEQRWRKELVLSALLLIFNFLQLFPIGRNLEQGSWQRKGPNVTEKWSRNRQFSDWLNLMPVQRRTQPPFTVLSISISIQAASLLERALSHLLLYCHSQTSCTKDINPSTRIENTQLRAVLLNVMHKQNHLEIVLLFRFWFTGSEVGFENTPF